jgi:hypothetical protein
MLATVASSSLRHVCCVVQAARRVIRQFRAASKELSALPA